MASAGPDGNPLYASTNITADGQQMFCIYPGGLMGLKGCPYSQTDGSFIPKGIPMQASAEECPPTINTAHLNSTGYNCSSTDNKGNSLIGASVTVSQELTCTYYDTTASSGYQCSFDTQGALNGTSDSCPSSAIPISGAVNSSSTSSDSDVPHGAIASSANSNKLEVAAAAGSVDSKNASGLSFFCPSYGGPPLPGSPDGTWLFTSMTDDTGEITYCSYGPTACYYSHSDGSLIHHSNSKDSQNDSNDCPSTINTADLPSNGYACSTKGIGYTVIGASITAANDLACVYADESGIPVGPPCLYDSHGSLHDALFNPCPSSAIPIPGAGNSSSSSSDVPHGAITSGNSNNVAVAAAAVAAAAAAPDSKKATGSGVPKPVFIALLAMNAFLVVAILIMGGIWIFRGSSGSAASHGYKKVTFARGPYDDSYLDAPVLPYDRPPSRM
ncbi:hypothetical protein C8R46DRAFT_1115280 [Mycena filopes]|nr:hypothetical protein C8R46DRAFT_1115280 [Mycena filopes]